MQHEMKITERPFERIREGIKILELRLYDEKRRIIKLGDTIRYSKLPDLTETVTVEVIGLLVYNTFAELIQDLPASYIGYQESDKEYLKGSMYEIYTKEQEKEYGALGIRIKVVT